MPGTLVSIFSYTTAPLVRPSMQMPACRVSSFSGIRPTLKSRVSQSNTISVPGMGLRCSSTRLTVTCSSLSWPLTSVTVWLRYSGMS